MANQRNKTGETARPFSRKSKLIDTFFFPFVVSVSKKNSQHPFIRIYNNRKFIIFPVGILNS